MLEALCRTVHDRGAKVCIQLTHAGAFADPAFNHGLSAKGPAAIFNPLTLSFSEPIADNEEIQARIEADFVRAIDICKDIGFDAVEIHLGHGYLLSQFLSTRTNPKYANNPKKRLEFPLRVLKSVCAKAHETELPGDSKITVNSKGRVMPSSVSSKWLAVLVKYNVSELEEKDLPLADVRMFTRAFVDAGADLLVPSGK